MKPPFLLSRSSLRFADGAEELRRQLSAAVISPDGSLWLSSDELRCVERLSPQGPLVYGDHQRFDLGDYVSLLDPSTEVDVEGLDYSDGYLWFTGSHSSKRKQTKGKNPQKDLERLAALVEEPNRNLLGRIPLVGGGLFRECSHPDRPDEKLSAATLQLTEGGNVLVDALREDPHLGPFLTFPLPSKENGFDIEGLAALGPRLWLGFRGPVLRGWAALVEIEVEEVAPGALGLRPIGPKGRPYRKHFLHMGGLGMRELCLDGDDLLVLAGPTMTVEGAMQLYRFRDIVGCREDSMVSVENGDLELVFDLPFTLGSDHAEGVTLTTWLGGEPAVMLVYDAPDEQRLGGEGEVLADIFRLPAAGA